MIIRYIKLDIKIKTNRHKPPFFTGSALRGAFGSALKKISCINPKFECLNCFASHSCLYHELYEAKNCTHRYRFDIELDSNLWDFSLYIFESICDKLPYVLSALNSAITELGLGYDRKTMEIRAIFANNLLVFDGNKFDLSDVKPIEFTTTQACVSKLTINFITPLRLKSDGKFIKSEDITLLNILLSVHRRYDELKGNGFQKHHIDFALKEIERKLDFLDLERYSNRQKTKMNLGGFVGFMEVKNASKEEFDILRLGEIIGVGKSTVFGLGKIKLEELE